MMAVVCVALSVAAAIGVRTTDPRDDALVAAAAQIGDELRASGASVVPVACAPELDPACTEGRGDVAAVVQLFRRDGRLGATALVDDPHHGGVRVRQALVPPSAGADPHALAWEALELLRAMGIEPRPAPPPPAEIVRASAVAAAPAPSWRWFVAAAAVGLAGPGRWGAAVGPELRVGVAPSERWGVRLVIAAPARSGDLGDADVRATLREGWATADGTWGRGAGRLRPYLIAGAGVYALSARADGDRAADGARWVVSPLARGGAGLDVAVAKTWSVIAEATASLLANAPVVALGPAELGRTGRPLVAASLGLAWRR